MLQQTTVATVIPRFARFVERWPTVEALAAAPDEDVLGEWAGLGYYARARNLIACAREVAARGGFPDTEAELRALPGLGAYTAAAIAAIAFGERGDGGRHQCRAGRRAAPRHRPPDRRGARRDPRARRGDDPADRPGDFAQAMMDLGATICRPRKPAVRRLPARRATAVAFASGDARSLSRAQGGKRDRPHRHGIAWWIERDGALWLVRRPAQGAARRDGGAARARVGRRAADASRRSPTVHHGFTHFTLDLHLVARAEPPPGDGWWHPLDRLAEAGPADALSPRGRGGARAEENACCLSPSSPAPGSTAPTPCAPSPSESPRSPRAPTRAQLVWDDGAPALDADGRLAWGAIDGEPPLFLGLDGEAPRFSALPDGDVPIDGRAHFGLLGAARRRRRADLRRRAQPRQLAPPPRLLLGVRAADRAQPRRLVARLRRLRRRTLSARRPGGDHARRA